MTTALISLQQQLSELFRRDEPIVDDPSLLPLARAIATGNERVSPEEQLDIYRRQFWRRHRDSLVEDFPGLLHVLGEEAFEAFARAYLSAHPPHDASLRQLPFDAPGFAATYPFPGELGGLARAMIAYELAFVDVFDGPEPVPLDAARVAALPPAAWETARIVLSPIVRRLTLEFPVQELRLAVRRGEAPALPTSPAPVHLLLFRLHDVVRFEALDPDASALLARLHRGVPLVGAIEDVTRGRSAAEVEHIGASVGGWFRRFAELGVFADIEV